MVSIATALCVPADAASCTSMATGSNALSVTTQTSVPTAKLCLLIIIIRHTHSLSLGRPFAMCPLLRLRRTITGRRSTRWAIIHVPGTLLRRRFPHHLQQTLLLKSRQLLKSSRWSYLYPILPKWKTRPRMERLRQIFKRGLSLTPHPTELSSLPTVSFLNLGHFATRVHTHGPLAVQSTTLEATTCAILTRIIHRVSAP